MCACETISPKLTTKVADQTVNARVDTRPPWPSGCR